MNKILEHNLGCKKEKKCSIKLITNSKNNDTASGMYLPSLSTLCFSTVGAEAARFTSSQYFLIGYTSSNGAYRLQVNSQIFATNATIATSDANYKKNINQIQNGLDIVNKLNPVSFEWKEHPIHNFNKGVDVGFLAQDVKKVLKDENYLDNVVKKNDCTYTNSTNDEIKEEFLGLSDSKLIPILTSAIKELSNKVNTLENENKKLNSLILELYSYIKK